jgi:hypothetical protein
MILNDESLYKFSANKFVTRQLLYTIGKHQAHIKVVYMQAGFEDPEDMSYYHTDVAVHGGD